jgi:hypothetical protein
VNRARKYQNCARRSSSFWPPILVARTGVPKYPPTVRCRASCRKVAFGETTRPAAPPSECSFRKCGFSARITPVSVKLVRRTSDLWNPGIHTSGSYRANQRDSSKIPVYLRATHLALLSTRYGFIRSRAPAEYRPLM